MNYRPSRFIIAREGWPFALPLLVVGALAVLFGLYVTGAVLLLVGAYVLYFFRNPERRAASTDPGAVISPADGLVVAAGITPLPEFPGGQALRVAVFMNVFNVHVNWAPYDGKVESAQHCPGKFLNAMENKSCEENERKLVVMRSPEGHMLLVRLVAGLIARRIVNPLEVGDQIRRGEKIGLIRFGSRVEVLVPADSALRVSVGQRVRGGETVVALLPTAGTS
jgi:phosphatidylserine decarboxylase